MTKLEQPKPLPLPLLLVYGKPTSADLPQASWFRIEDRLAVTSAAHSLKFTVVEIASEDDRALLTGVHEGVLKGAGRMIVGSVAADMYRRIDEHMRVRIGASDSRSAGSDAEKGNPRSEQNTNPVDTPSAAAATGKALLPAEERRNAASSVAPSSNKPTAAPVTEAWAVLRVGSHVVAKHWNSDGEPDGWWIAVVTALDRGDFVIRWPDEPKTPPLKIERKHVAILHPDFNVAREWDRKPNRRS